MAEQQAQRPFIEEVPALLAEREMSVNVLAQRVGVSQSHLSRILRKADYQSVSGDLARRIAVALELPEDYFVETRQRFVIDAIRRDPELRERLYQELRKPQ